MDVKKLPMDCWGGNDAEEAHSWWEPPHVVYGLNNSRVRSRLERLVGTYIVRPTDKEFMMTLFYRKREDHKDQLLKRILERQEGELVREKRLILEGRMSMSQAPEELFNHPVFRITQLSKQILMLRKLKEEGRKRKKYLKRFDYSLLEGMEEEVVSDTELSSCVDSEDIEKGRDWELEYNQHHAVSEDYERIKYEDEDIAELREVELVDELYPLGDLIVGPLGSKRCGGLLK